MAHACYPNWLSPWNGMPHLNGISFHEQCSKEKQCSKDLEHCVHLLTLTSKRAFPESSMLLYRRLKQSDYYTLFLQ